MRKPYDRFVHALHVFSAALCLLMLAVVLVGVFYRYVVNEALSWYDEFAGYVLVWITMYGSAAALARRKHIGFETLVELFPRPLQRALEVFSILCVGAFSLVLLVPGWRLIREMGGDPSVSLPSVQMAWIYSAMPISGAFMLVICAVQLVRALAPGRGAEPEKARPMEEGQ